MVLGPLLVIERWDDLRFVQRFVGIGRFGLEQQLIERLVVVRNILGLTKSCPNVRLAGVGNPRATLDG